MSEQILLQGKILGTGEFLAAGHAEGRSARSAGEDLLAGRSQWLTLLCEVLPRALLAELGLARILLGSSGGGQFLVVLPGEARNAAENFLAAAARQVSELSDDECRTHAQSRSALPVRWRKTASRSGSSTSTELTATPASATPRSSSGSTVRARSTISATPPSSTVAARTATSARQARAAFCRSPIPSRLTRSCSPTRPTNSALVPSALSSPRSTI